MPEGLALVCTAALAVLIGAECVRAGVGHDDDVTGTIVQSAAIVQASANRLTPAELDPVFMQKLADRWHARYERSHPFASRD